MYTGLNVFDSTKLWLNHFAKRIFYFCGKNCYTQKLKRETLWQMKRCDLMPNHSKAKQEAHFLDVVLPKNIYEKKWWSRLFNKRKMLKNKFHKPNVLEIWTNWILLSYFDFSLEQMKWTTQKIAARVKSGRKWHKIIIWGQFHQHSTSSFYARRSQKHKKGSQVVSLC